MNLSLSKTLFVATVVSLACGAALPASALEFSQRGMTATFSGPIKLGDNARFEAFMARPEAASIRAIYLNSGGGSLSVSLDIARLIRRKGLATVADGRSRCESACTILFAGGSTRHYINSGGLEDRLGGRPGGLGYHEANNANADGRGTQYSGRGSQSMINAYYELGARGAPQFATKAGFRQMYRISGPTAIQNGLATSLAAP